MTEFYTTRLTIEVEVKTQFGPKPAVNLVCAKLSDSNAITDVKLIACQSNYTEPRVPPMSTLLNFPIEGCL